MIIKLNEFLLGESYNNNTEAAKDNIRNDVQHKLTALDVSFRELADFVDSFSERVATKTICKQLMKKFKFTYEEAKWILEEWFAVTDLDESYNNNTEEQELAEFLDWLKQEKIRVTDVNKKFKMIHIQNPDDLDMASWYLHDRDYFKKLSDFGWMVSAPSPVGRKVAKALKMESKKLKEGLRYFVTDDDYIPLREQPNEGYTELQAVERAQREAERSAKLFNLKVSETAKWYHIMDSNHKIRHDLDTAI